MWLGNGDGRLSMFRLSDAKGENDIRKPSIDLPRHSGSVYSLASSFTNADLNNSFGAKTTLLASGADVDIALWSVNSNIDQHQSDKPGNYPRGSSAMQPPAKKQHVGNTPNNRANFQYNSEIDGQESGGELPEVRLLWRAEHPREKLSAGGLGSLVETNGLCFHPLGLVSASGDGVVRLWDVERGAVKAELARHTGAAHCVATPSNHNNKKYVC